jgi:hypothetical protein
MSHIDNDPGLRLTPRGKRVFNGLGRLALLAGLFFAISSGGDITVAVWGVALLALGAGLVLVNK